MDDWDEVGRVSVSPNSQLAVLPQTFAFDSSQELLWVGTPYGRVESYYGSDLKTKYARFKCGKEPDIGPVYQILFHEKGVVALTGSNVHMATRRGQSIWHVTHKDMKELRCMSFTSRGTSEILVAGFQDQMFIIDVDKGTILKQMHTNDHYEFMKRSRYICAATSKGAVNILDPVTLSVVRTWNAHPSGINDIDAQHDFLVTCGYTIRHGHTNPDPLVNVFDLKNMVSLPPIPFPSIPARVRMHPRMSTTTIVVSDYGQLQILDLMNVNTSNIKAINLSKVSGLDIAPSGEAMAFAGLTIDPNDPYAGGMYPGGPYPVVPVIQLWGSPSRVRFAELSNPTEFPDHEEDIPQLDWSFDTPLSSVGMPYYRETLLSAWPSHMIFEVGAPPLKLLPSSAAAASSLRVENWGVHGPNPRNTLRNQIENTRLVEKAPAGLQAPKFLSEKAKETPTDTNGERRISDAIDHVGADSVNVNSGVPATYQNVNIKYSRFGVADFDFGYYNKTKYSGLEIHITNSYANSLLQVLHFIPLIRNLALQHTATSCINDTCLLCEMGFLFDMLEKAEGTACHATNFLKTFSSHPQAGPLGLMEEEAVGSPLTTMLQGLNRFLLDRIAQDWRSMPPYAPTMDQVLSTGATTSIECMNCRSKHTRPGTSYVNELSYPSSPLVRNARQPGRPIPTFSQVLKNSVEREQTSRGWCSRCQRYQPLSTKRGIHTVPDILMLNAAITSPEAKQLWAIPQWLPEEIGIIIDQGKFFCFEGDALKFHLQQGRHSITVYALVGFAAEISSGQNQIPHLVSFVNVAHSQQMAPTESQWHLFNDFLVRPIKTEEALSFNTTWKLPSVLAYQNKIYNNRVDNSWKQTLDTSLLYMDTNVNPERTYHTLVPPEEAPREGTLIALDTEFVSVRQSEIEVNADGDLETIRPTVYALARVSVIRGSGEHEGLPFIDDYVAGKEPVIDYLTSYSGIVREDLDPRISKHNLVPLKVAYKKLWILLNLGCKFLGHGLKQDFRVTNIHVPKAQVIDTSDFFYIKLLKRKLSLAFLAWYLLKEDIQVETHDSIEDARTALKLYRKYLEFQDAGILDTIVQDIYRKGKEMAFKPPPAKKDGHLIERMETPPILNESPYHGTGATPASGPTTPVRRPIGLAPGTGSTFSSGWTPGKGSSGLGGSPLR